MTDAVADLLSYIDRSPTPYHAVAETTRRLQEAGFRPQREAEAWGLEPGDQGFVVRGEGSLLAFVVGTESPAVAGFRMVGAHTDSLFLSLHELVRSTQAVVNNSQYATLEVLSTLISTMTELSTAIEQLNALIVSLENYPSNVLYAAPPPEEK